MVDALIKAVRNLLNFAEERENFSLEYITKLRKVLKIKPAGVRKIFINDEELIEAYDKVKDSLKPFFKLLVYSGMRLSHAVSMVRNYDISNLVVKDNIARYPINWLSKGKKRGYWATIRIYSRKSQLNGRLYPLFEQNQAS